MKQLNVIIPWIVHSVLYLLLHGTTTTAAERVPHRALSRVNIGHMWVESHAITVTLILHNISSQKILVSVRKGNDSSITVVDYVPAPVQLYDSKGVKQYPPDPERIHKIEELSPSTEYEVCASLSGQATETSGQCFTLTTLPNVDNVKGAHIAPAIIAIFLLIVGFVWIIYKTVLTKYFRSSRDTYNVRQM